MMREFDPKRIIVFVQPNLGDGVHHTITTHWVHESWPNARIVVVTGPLAGQVLRGCPWIDAVWSCEGFRYRVLPKILFGRFDLALLPYANNPASRMAVLARIPRTVAIKGGKLDGRLWSTVEFHPTENAICDAFEAVLVAAGGSAGDHEPFVAREPSAILEVDRLLGSVGRRRVALMTGAGHGNKCWPRERFAELARRFLSHGLEVVSVGGPKDAGALADVRGVIDVAGRGDAMTTAEVLRRAALVVSNDTGAAHLASAVRTPVVVIYGPSRVLLPPGGPSKILRRNCGCSDFDWDACDKTCLRDHTVDKVFDASMALLQPQTSTAVVEADPEPSGRSGSVTAGGCR